jgi:mRNA-degrading endonuclease RelE of RelBE toxin-antitoxin system
MKQRTSKGCSYSYSVTRKKLEEFPLIGRIYPIENKEFRELKIKYGSSGYVCLYSFDPMTDIVLVHAFRHQRELGYSAFNDSWKELYLSE